MPFTYLTSEMPGGGRLRVADDLEAHLAGLGGHEWLVVVGPGRGVAERVPRDLADRCVRRREHVAAEACSAPPVGGRSSRSRHGWRRRGRAAAAMRPVGRLAAGRVEAGHLGTARVVRGRVRDRRRRATICTSPAKMGCQADPRAVGHEHTEVTRDGQRVDHDQVGDRHVADVGDDGPVGGDAAALGATDGLEADERRSRGRPSPT